jgi:peptidyl-prolyl cis-trans isomerase C
VIRSTVRAASAALLALLALAGCGPESRPVARVGQHTLTVADFQRAARRAGNAMRLPAEQARPLVLEQMVTNELLLIAARAHGLDTMTSTRNQARALAEQALLGALSAQLSSPDPGVTEAEARKLYEWRKTQSDVQLVYTADSASIQVALRRIAAGEPMSQVADEFGGSGTLPPGGKLGNRLPGSLPWPVDDAARTLPVGQVGGPYHAAMGWFLVRVSGRTPAEVRPFEQDRATLEGVIRQRKWQGALFAGVAGLGAEWHLALAPDAGQALFHALSPGRVGALGNSPPTAAERTQVLARFDGGAYTLGDAWDDLSRPELNKPNSSLVPSLSAWVRERAVLRVAVAEARRRHLDEDPAVAGPLADQVDDLLLQGEYARLTAGIAPPDEASLRATWEGLKDRYPMLREARVQWAVIADTAKIMAIGRNSEKGSLRDIAREIDPAIVVHEESLRFPNGDPRWAGAHGMLQQMEPGQWASPEITDGGVRLLQLVDKAQGPVSWEQLPPDVQQSLASNVMQRARGERVAAYTDSLRRAVNPVLLPDALRNVPWPSLPAGTP